VAVIDRDGPWDDGVGDPLILSMPEEEAESNDPKGDDLWLYVAGDGRFLHAGATMPAKEWHVVGALPIRTTEVPGPDGRPVKVAMPRDYVPDDAPEAKVLYRRVVMPGGLGATEEEKEEFAKRIAAELFKSEDGS
jgi:hypothetical protein